MWRWLLALAVLLTMMGAAQAQPPPPPAPCVPNSDSTSFNATTDAHKVGLVDMKPGTDYDSAPRLTAAINYVIGNPNCKNLVADPGTYYFYSAAPSPVQPVKTSYVYVQPATGLKIDLRGSQLIFKESFFTAFYIDQCKACEFSNFSIDFEHLPFTQLDVKNVHADEITADPQPNWPNPPELFNHQAQVGGGARNVDFVGFDRRGGVPLYDYTDWKLPAPPWDRAHRIAINPQGVIKKDDVFIVTARGGGPAIYEQNGAGTIFKDIAIYTSGGVGIESSGSQAMSFIGIHIVPKPDTGRLVSTVAGGIALNSMAGPGFVVRNCFIDGTQDDSIAGNVTAVSTPVPVLSRGTALIPGWPANPVFFMNGTTGATVGAPPVGQGYEVTLKSPPFIYSIKPSLTQGQVTQLGNNAYVYSRAGYGTAAGVTVQNNQITNSYFARGIAFSGVSNASITHNTITNTQQAGIVLGTDLPTNVPIDKTLIANNLLTNTNMGMSGVGQSYLGAIEIMAYATNGDVMATQLNHHAFINTNTVTNTQRAGIWIGNVHGGAVNDNRLSGIGLSLGNLGIDPHLNDGLKPYASQAFAAGVLAWCTVDVATNSPFFVNMCPGTPGPQPGTK